MNFKDYDLFDDMSLDEQVRHVNEAFNRLRATDVALSVLAAFNIAFVFGLQEWISLKAASELQNFESRQFLLELLVLQSTILVCTLWLTQVWRFASGTKWSCSGVRSEAESLRRITYVTVERGSS